MSAMTTATDQATDQRISAGRRIVAVKPLPGPPFFRGLMFGVPLAGSVWVAIYGLARALF
jgi:hypothetical protein